MCIRDRIATLKNLVPWELDWLFERDDARIGPDMMYQKLWHQCDTDIFIFHADMKPFEDDDLWWEQVQYHADQFPEAGILGCKLLYPLRNEKEQYYVECAGGKFTDGKPDHYGSGIEIGSRLTFKTPEADEGQYNGVREVAWYTFGGIFIRRQVLNEIGDFDPLYEWSYNRDVDYCLRTREKGWKIYQIPVSLFHHQSKDVKRIKTQDNVDAETRNLMRLKSQWQNNELYQTINRTIKEPTHPAWGSATVSLSLIHI